MMRGIMSGAKGDTMDDTLLRKIKPCAIDKPFIFVSYSAKDKETVYRDVYELQIRGWNIWLDERNLDKSNDSWKQDALDAITLATCKMGLFYVSKDSLSSENCYDEIKQTESEKAKARHFMVPVKFLAIEVKEIDDIEKYAQNVIDNLTYSNLSLEEKNRRTEVVTYFVHGPFKGNNEKVRIKPIDTYPSEEDYYKAMVEQFTMAGLRPTETDYFPRVKLYREACAKMSSAKTDIGYRSASKKFYKFISTFSIEELEGTAGNDFFLFEELQDAKQREKLCRDKAEAFQKDAIYDDAISLMKQKTGDGYNSAREKLRQIPGWKDADKKIIECQKGMDTIHEEDYQKAKNMLLRAKTQEDCKEAADAFERLNGYKDAKDMVASCKEKGEQLRKQSIYDKAINNMNSHTKEGYQAAIKEFESILGWSDTEKKIVELQEAVKSLDSTKYVGAMEKLTDARTYEEFRSLANTFESLGGYKDSETLVTHCKTMANEAKKHQQASHQRMIVEIILAVALCLLGFGVGWMVKPKEVVIKSEPCTVVVENVDIEELKAMLKKADVGDTIAFGRYEQDNDISNKEEPIEWIVLDKEEDGTLLLLSKYVLDVKPYHNINVGVTWGSCSLRDWLYDEDMENNPDTFYAQAFDDHENVMVLLKDIKTDGSKDTHDKVFLLSIEEAQGYFSNDEARQCKPTDYAISRNVYVNENTGACRWWLRSPGNYGNNAASVLIDGSVYAIGDNVKFDYIGVRPACRVNPES